VIEPSPAEDAVARAVVDGVIAVHRALGPGLLESVYEHCLAHELEARGLAVQRQVAMPVVYRGVRIETGFRLDLLVADRVVVEVKAMEAILSVHGAQMLTCPRLAGRPLGLLINFNAVLLTQGIRRYVRS
jgi:GxxExxY protein